jgi:hypothetical protein
MQPGVFQLLDGYLGLDEQLTVAVNGLFAGLNQA